MGLVGPNGSGKTSLLGILAGLDDEYRGRVSRKPALSLGFVPQRCDPPDGLSCLEVLVAESVELRRRMDALAEAMADWPFSSGGRGTGAPSWDAALREHGELAERYEALGGDDAEAVGGKGGAAARAASLERRIESLEMQRSSLERKSELCGQAGDWSGAGKAPEISGILEELYAEWMAASP